MTPLRFRPEIVRIPWQAIAAFAAALYFLRSALRSFDFRPDVPDFVVFGALALILIARPLAARWLAGDDEGAGTAADEEPPRAPEAPRNLDKSHKDERTY